MHEENLGKTYIYNALKNLIDMKYSLFKNIIVSSVHSDIHMNETNIFSIRLK